MIRRYLVPALLCILALMLLRPGAKAQTPTRFTVTTQGVADGGAGDILLIPGLASSREVFAAEAKILAPKYRLRLLQIGGFAGAPAGPNANGPLLAPIVEEMHGYIVANKIHPAVIGHSLGGLLALMLADAHPEDVSKIMIVDALPFYGLVFNPGATVDLVRPQAQAMGEQMLKMPDDQFAAMQPSMVAAMVKDPEGRKLVAASSVASDRTVFVHAMLEDLETDVRPDLAKIKTPATLLYPVDPTLMKDVPAVTSLYTTAYSGMPNLKVVKIEDSRHFIMYDQPAAFDAAVQGFLRP